MADCSLEIILSFLGIGFLIWFVHLFIFPRRHRLLDYVTYLCKKLMNGCRQTWMQRHPTASMEESTGEEKTDGKALDKQKNGTEEIQYRLLPDNVECKFQEIIIPPLRSGTRGPRHPPAIINFSVIRVTTPEQL